jgi:hypothetical protein
VPLQVEGRAGPGRRSVLALVATAPALLVSGACGALLPGERRTPRPLTADELAVERAAADATRLRDGALALAAQKNQPAALLERVAADHDAHLEALGAVPLAGEVTAPPTATAAPPRAAAPTQAPAATRAASAPPAPAVGAPALPASVTFVHGVQPRTWKSRAIVLGKLLLAGALAAAVSPLVWPFDFRCGPDLGLYLGGIAAATLAGVWAARSSWRHRAGLAHTASLLLVLWGLSLAAWLALPRVGLGLPDAQRITVWQCR